MPIVNWQLSLVFHIILKWINRKNCIFTNWRKNPTLKIGNNRTYVEHGKNYIKIVYSAAVPNENVVSHIRYRGENRVILCLLTYIVHSHTMPWLPAEIPEHRN